MPFALGVDEDTGVLLQMPNARVSDLLSVVYDEGYQLGTPLANDGLGHRYLEDFLEFIADALGERLARGLVLEIGCGGGALLEALSRRATQVVGIEPGASAVAEARRRGLNVIQAPFSADAFEERFDLVVHYAVLEHIEDPASFLLEQLQLLAPGGAIALSVPDCTAALATGDISPFIHEHWSYFTHSSFVRLARAAGARVARLRRARVGGAIHALLEPAADGDALPEVTPEPVDADAFVPRARDNMRRLECLTARIAEQGGTLGLYPGGRFINYHALLERHLPASRYFDDDPRLEGLYYPSIPVGVESRASLLSEPVDELLITSWSFGAELARQLGRHDALRGTVIRTIGEVLSPSFAR
jgi:SAM-dependent methyltransferase